MYDQKTASQTPRYPGGVNIGALTAIFDHCGDFESRAIDFGLEGYVSVHVCWLDGLVSGDAVSEQVLRPLTQSARAGRTLTEADCMARVFSGGVYRQSIHRRADLDSLVSDLCHGHCAVVFDGCGAAFSFELRSEAVRSVDQPNLEKALKGAKDSFVETLRVNTALVRNRICSPELKLADTRVGSLSNTRVAILFVEGLVDPALVARLAARLDALDAPALLATGTLEEALVDAPRSPFPQLLHTERPDRFAMYLLEGRVGLLIDGLPVGLVLPATLADFMKVTGDSSMHFLAATGLTMLRYAALMLAALMPALYVAVAAYHQEMIPVRLLLAIIDAERQVPFSSALEVLSMLAAFGLLQEAGLRMPDPVGDTVSIIGALIVGQAAVQAQVVSPIAIIVVAISGICCYTLPSQDLAYAVRLCRLLLLLGAIAAGLYGLGLVCCLLLLHLSSIDSFGGNYTAPLSAAGPGLWRLLVRKPKKSENPVRLQMRWRGRTRRFFSILLLLCMLPSLSGCAALAADRREVEQLQVIQVLGLDYAPGGVALSLASASGQDEFPVCLSAEGVSISAALERLRADALQEEIFCGHVQHVLVGERAAREGLYPLLSYLCRSTELRLDLPIFVVRGVEARELMENAGDDVNGVDQILQTAELRLNSRSERGRFTAAQIIRNLERHGSSLVCALEYRDAAQSNARTAALSGLGILKEGKLVRFLDEDGFLGAALLTNTLGVTELNVHDIEGRTVTLQLQDGSTTLRPLWGDAGALLGLDLSATVRADLLEAPSEGDSSREAYADYLTAQLETAVSERIGTVLQLAKQLQTDFLGLSDAVELSSPAQYRALGQDLGPLLPELEISITVRGSISHSNDMN